MISIKQEEFRQFADYIKTNYGIHFKDEKKTLLEGRLGPLMMSMNFDSLLDYLEYVKADKTGQAASVMLNRITTNHTFFMREPAHFDYFSKVVLPYLTQTVREKDLRIWSAACSSGEEPYTLAMLISEYFGTSKGNWDTRILATDISQNVLDIARAGVYGAEKVNDVPGAWLSKYFTKNDREQYVISEKIKQEVIFSKLNLMDTTYPFRRKMHAIFCRNVMIYFDNETKDNLVEHLYDTTEPGGFLFIGHAESLNREKTRYRYIMPAVYRKE